jgi:hypothetical protein
VIVARSAGADPFFPRRIPCLIGMKDHISTTDMLSIGLSVLFPTLISIFGVLVGLILIAYILGALTGACLMHNHDSAAH